MCLEIREMCPTVPLYRRRIERFLASNSLRYDDVDYYAALVDTATDEIVAGGGLKGDIIKCVAVAEGYKGEAVANSVVSHLIARASASGHHCVRLFTKPANRKLFESVSFRLLAEAGQAVLMETGVGGIEDVRRYLKSCRVECEQLVGCVVANCNPFTKGHLYLVEQAARQVGWLYVMVVGENCSMFDYAERKAMARLATAHLPNVSVVDGNAYAVSSTTFPTYFLKRVDDASATQMELDIDLYRRHIAPALGATVRFVGSEPTDVLTRQYNAAMCRMLPDVRVVERVRMDGTAVSASLVRRWIVENRLAAASRLVPHTDIPYLLGHMATRAIKAELNTTPKPGLVDCRDNGAHTDMDHGMMLASIRELHPFFVRLALMGYDSCLPPAHLVQEVGIEAEAAMLTTTKGVNTYRGALFAMGLAVVAAAHALYDSGGAPGTDILGDVRRGIMTLAGGMAAANGTHGRKVCVGNAGRIRLKGALESAKEGYGLLFGEWLPFYDSGMRCADSHVMHKTLLRIMCDLDDTNVVYRTSVDTLDEVKAEARHLLADFSIEGLERMNDSFVRRNISPGGSADMLSLVVFLHGIGRKM